MLRIVHSKRKRRLRDKEPAHGVGKHFRRCQICGFILDADKTATGTGSGITLTETGSGSYPDLYYDPIVSSGCPFCGSKNF